MKWLLLFVAFSAHAQYQGPAVEACRAYAQKETGKEAKVLLERDRNLLIDRYARKAGSQFVSSVLSGNGAVVYGDAPSAEFSFICLLADEKRPVFFSWLPRRENVALSQCTRAEKLRASPQPCFDVLLRAAEEDLGLLYAALMQEANQRGAAALASYRRSNEEWRQYRDAECQRRGELGGELQRTACMIDLTRRRALDLQ